MLQNQILSHKIDKENYPLTLNALFVKKIAVETAKKMYMPSES